MSVSAKTINEILSGSTAQVLSPEMIMACLEARRASWSYEGEPIAAKAHARLTSGLHSDGFFNMGGVLKECPNFRNSVALTMLDVLEGYYPIYDSNVGYVVGADTSSTLLAADVAALLGCEHLRMQKSGDSGSKVQIWVPDNPVLEDDALILHVEELVTTNSSAEAVRAGVTLANPGIRVRYVPFVPVGILRPAPGTPKIMIGNSEILALVFREVSNFPEASCPYCAVGSKAVEPKTQWQELVA